MKSVIVHYQEIALKGRNRPWFVNRLVRHLRAATADLMFDFYAGLRRGQPPAAALRQAQLAARRRRSHPFFWAAFSLMGRW